MFEFWRKRKKELRDIKIKIEDESLLTVSESRQLRSEIFQLQSEFDDVVKRKDIEIDNLKQELLEKDKQDTHTEIMTPHQAYQDLRGRDRPIAYNPEEYSENTTNMPLEVYKLLAELNLDSHNPILDSPYFYGSPEQIVATKYHFDLLEDNGLIRRWEYSEDTGGIEVTKKGRRIYMETKDDLEK